MSIELARNVLLWCTVVNYGVLLVWFLCLCVRARLDSAHPWQMVSLVGWFG
jgi:hypothetical protein